MQEQSENTDIFISYAHIDNQPFANEAEGWITHFVNNLRNLLGKKIGRSEHYHLWMDFRLKGSDDLTPEIEKQIKATETLLILLSPGWITSEWCQRELSLFLKYHKDVSGRIFVAELDRVKRADKPEHLHDLLAYPFWQLTPQDTVKPLGYPIPRIEDGDYYDRLLEVSNHVAEKLKTINPDIGKPAAVTSSDSQTTAPFKPPTTLTTPKATVYVAPVNDSLYSQRAKLISELQQYGIAALPRNNNFQHDMDADLAQCSHFVQLLDAQWTMGIPCDQHFIADTAEKPILQWRDSKLDYTQAHNEQKQLLEGETVIAGVLSDFIRYVREMVLPKPPDHNNDDEPDYGDETIFIHASQEDLEYARAVANHLQVKGFGIVLTGYTGDPQRIRKNIERGYQECNRLLMIHHETDAAVMEDYLWEARGRIIKSKNKVPILLCQHEEAEKLDSVPPKVSILPCNSNFDEHCLQQFLDTLEVKA